MIALQVVIVNFVDVAIQGEGIPVPINEHRLKAIKGQSALVH